MNIAQAVELAAERFRKAELPEGRLDAEYIVAEASGIPRLRLGLERSKALDAAAEKRLRGWVEERLRRRPLAYILGEQPFMNLQLHVEPAVLIPRPETELLVERAFRLLDQMRGACAIDVGTGSGNIALSLVNHPQAAAVHAVDVSPAALSVAQQNERRQLGSRPVRWHLGDLLSPIIAEDLRAELIVANLPYVRSGEIAELSPEVRCEPILALDGGPDGLMLIRVLINQAERVLNDGGGLLLEIGADQGDAVVEILRSRPIWTQVELIKDLAQLPRIVQAQKGSAIGFINN